MLLPQFGRLLLRWEVTLQLKIFVLSNNALFNDAFNYSHCRMLKCMMISEQSGNIFNVLSWPLPVRTEEEHKQTISITSFCINISTRNSRMKKRLRSTQSTNSVQFRTSTMFVLQSYLKCLDKLQEWVFHIKTNKKFHINIRTKKKVFWF
jgi:hypothetical protein